MKLSSKPVRFQLCSIICMSTGMKQSFDAVQTCLIATVDWTIQGADYTAINLSCFISKLIIVSCVDNCNVYVIPNYVG